MAIRPFLLELQLCVIIFLRVAEQAEVNNMPASNLAIGEISSQLSLLFDFRIQNMLVHENLLSLILVFGPTLLKTTEGSASLSSLVDTVHQTRVVELLTRFNPDDPSQNARYLQSTLCIHYYLFRPGTQPRSLALPSSPGRVIKEGGAAVKGRARGTREVMLCPLT